MAKKNKYRKTTADDFFDYKEGKLSPEEQHAFERQMQSDTFDEEALEGLSMLSRQEARETLAGLTARIDRRIRRNRRIAWYSAAAAVAAIAVVTTIFLNIDNDSINLPDPVPQMEKAIQDISSEGANGETDVFEKKAVIEEETNNPEESIAAGESFLVEEKERKAAEGSVKAEGKGAAEVEALAAGESEIVAAKKEAADVIPEIDETGETITAIEDDMEVEMEEINAAQAGKGLAAIPAQPEVTIEQEPEDEQEPGERYEDKGVPALQRSRKQTNAYQVADREKMYQPTGQISGIVRSAEDLQPMSGVSLVLKGTTVGTVTNSEGQFTLTPSASEESTIVASFVGMETEEVSFEPMEPLEIAMVPSQMQLDEVVVLSGETTAADMRTGAAKEINMDAVYGTDYTSATPVTGFKEYSEYIDSVLVFPPQETVSEKAVVVLKFSVNTSGMPYNFRVIRSPSQPFSMEAIRAVMTGPAWTPASRNGIAIEETVRLRVVFTEKHLRQ